MSKIKLTGSNSGYVEISSAADAGNLTLQLPTAGTALLSNAGNVFSGITTTGQLDINGSIDVSSTSVFNDDLTLTGASYDVLWDSSDNQLEFGDNAKLSFGASSDLQIFHDGNNSFINEVGSGNLIFNTSAFQIKDQSNSTFALTAIPTSFVKLFYNNSVKLETTNTGAVVSGICTATSFSGSGEGLTRTTQLSHRNLIINGDMQVAQRSTSAVNIPGGKTVTDVDRFGQWTRVTEGNFKTGQQVADAPAGFQYSRKITSSAANTLSSNSYHAVRYAVEGYDAAQLNCGNSSAKTVTLSFYVKSSLTGSFGLNFTNSANNRCYPTTYTISSANTWEQKSITLTLDTSGTWLINSGVGLEINWKLAVGSSYDVSNLNQWQNNWRFPENTVNLLTTNGATFQLTGVQLEVGQQATPFEHRRYGESLMDCYRYYVKIFTNTSDFPFGVGYKYASGAHACSVQLPTSLRSTPTCTFSGLRIRGGHTGGSNQEDNVTGIGGMSYSNTNFQSFTANTSQNNTSIGQTVVLTNSVSNNSSYIAFDAEI